MLNYYYSFMNRNETVVISPTSTSIANLYLDGAKCCNVSNNIWTAYTAMQQNQSHNTKASFYKNIYSLDYIASNPNDYFDINVKYDQPTLTTNDPNFCVDEYQKTNYGVCLTYAYAPSVCDLTNVSITGGGNVVAGSTVTFSATPTGTGIYNYVWTGPDFTSTSQNPTITTNAQTWNSGVYSACKKTLILKTSIPKIVFFWA
jgi:hypothetical protein